MFNHLKNLLHEIEMRMSHLVPIPYEEEFIIQIKLLDSNEKVLLSKKIYNLIWNIGSARIFKIFKDLKLIDISLYLLRQDEVTCQNILNDLLITEFSLLKELIVFAYCGSSNSHLILAMLEKSFTMLIQDLSENPNLNQNNYIAELKHQHLDDELLQQIQDLHIRIFLDLESCSIEQAFRKQNKWNCEYLDGVLFDLMKESISNENSLNSLFLTVKLKHLEFNEWKYYIKLLNMVAINLKTKQCRNIIKDFLKENLKQFLLRKCETFFLIMLLTARQICSVNTEILGEYSQWYKTTIGEMMYKMTTDEFKYTMNTLTKIISYEEDCEIIKIHIHIGIAAPHLCNELVFNYKQLLKVRLKELEEGVFHSINNTQNTSNVIIINDEH